MPLYDHVVGTGAWWEHVDAVASGLLGPILRARRPDVEPIVRTSRVRAFVATHADRLSPLPPRETLEHLGSRSSKDRPVPVKCDDHVSTAAPGHRYRRRRPGRISDTDVGSTTRSAATSMGRHPTTSIRKAAQIMNDLDPRRPPAPARSRWHRITRHATTKLGAFGATAAMAIGACGPAAMQCAPPAPAPAPPAGVALAAKPVQAPCTFSDTWGAARSGGRTHLGTDIMARQGQEVYAVQAGQITKVYREATDALAGNGIRLTQADGTFWFYAHMSAVAPGIGVGTQVAAGQLVGWVGRTGNAGVDHLHLELHPGGGAAVNSYPVIVAAGGAC